MTGGQQACPKIPRNVFFTVTGTNSQFEKISLGLFKWLAKINSFQEDTYDDMLIETDRHLGDVQVVGVGLNYDPISDLVPDWFDCHWYVNFISIIDLQNGQETHFPCYHWIGYNSKEITAASKIGT